MTVAIWLLALAVSAPAQPPSALSEQAQRLAASKQFAAAEKLWRQALAQDPKFFPALFNLGYMHFSNGQPAEARPWLERAAASNPKDFNTSFLLGRILLGLDDRDGALRRWRTALALQPDNVKLMRVMIVEYEKGLYYGEAETLAHKALDRDPRDLDLHLMAIHACQNARNLAAGQKIARLAVERFPDSARASFEYGFHLQRAGRLGQAIDFLQRAMKLDPAYEEPFFFYGDLLVTEGRDDEAIPYLQKAIAIRGDYLPPRLSLARALIHLEKWREATAELEAAAKTDSKHPEPHLLLSRVYFRTGDEKRAAIEKEIAARLRQENPHALEAVQGRLFR